MTAKYISSMRFQVIILSSCQLFLLSYTINYDKNTDMPFEFIIN
jgi:hypothetical protein